MTTNDDRRYRSEHPDFFGDNWPFVGEAHRPSRTHAIAVRFLLGLVVGLGAGIVILAVRAVGQAGGWW